MKKKLFLVLFMFTLLFSLVSCSGEKASDTDKKTETKANNNQKGGEINIGDEILLGDGKFVGVIEDIVVLKDINGKPAISIKYNVTNNSEEEQGLLDMFVVNAKQDGKDLDMAVLNYEDEDPNKREDIFEPVKPGENSGLDETYYSLNSDSDVLISISNIKDAFEGVEYKLTFPISK